MSDANLEQRVLSVFGSVAPDVDPMALSRHVPFRDQFDFDSMDTLNFALGLHQTFAVEIPEKDYPRLSSLDSAVAYLRDHGVS